MGTDTLSEIQLRMVRQWRITIRSNDPVEIRYEEPFSGNARQARRRTQIMTRRTSYMVNQPNRAVYWMLEVFDAEKHTWRKIKDGWFTLPRDSKAPAET